jgi:benzoylformate decarboxylase
MTQLHTVRSAVLEFLEAASMTTIFGNPGSTELPMFRDFPDHFSYVLGLQESVVIGMADGYAQATRNAAFVNLHSAAGVGHALGNIFTAYKNETPLVITAGQQARSILPYEPFLFAQQAAEFPKPYVKWSCEPARAEDVPAAIARAYYVAMQAPQGPTFVSVPVDDWDRPCDPVPFRTVSRSGRGDEALLAQVAGDLALSSSPVIVVGAEVAREEAWDETLALAEALQAPVWVSPMSARNSFPETHPLFAGFLPAMREKIVAALGRRDLVLALGAPVFPYHVEGFGPHIPEGSKLYQLTSNPDLAAWAPIGTAIVTNLKSGVAALLAGLPQSERPASSPHREPPPSLPVGRLSDKYLLQRIAALRPPGAVIVEEAPSSRGPMHDYLPIIDPDGFYTCASGGLGHGLPAAIGVALGRPDKRIIAILGDGSAMYAIQGLWTAAQLGLNISFVIINNGRYEALQDFGRHFGLQRTVGTLLPGLDFALLARAQGCDGARVETAAALDDALLHVFAADRPSVLEVVVE